MLLVLSVLDFPKSSFPFFVWLAPFFWFVFWFWFFSSFFFLLRLCGESKQFRWNFKFGQYVYLQSTQIWWMSPSIKRRRRRLIVFQRVLLKIVCAGQKPHCLKILFPGPLRHLSFDLLNVLGSQLVILFSLQWRSIFDSIQGSILFEDNGILWTSCHLFTARRTRLLLCIAQRLTT